MKFTIALAVFATFVAATLAAPVDTAPNYDDVKALVQQVAGNITVGIQQVKAIANQDNAAVGADIERKLKPREDEATAVLNRAMAAVEARTLTESEARGFFASLNQTLTAARNEISPDVQKLSPAVQAQILQILNTAFSTVEALANDIYAELAKAAIEFAPDYPEVGRKIGDVANTVNVSVTQVKAIANQDNAAVGADIERKLLPRENDAKAVLGQASAAVEARTLTEDQARGFFGTLNATLAGARTDILPDVAKLSPPSQSQISELLNSAYTRVEALANEIYALLRA